MKTSLIYQHIAIYSLFMRILYGRYYKERFKAISDEIPDGAKVIDICCGDCSLFKYELGGRVDYTGLEINSNFVKSAKKRNINVFKFNMIEEIPPPSEYIIMQSSLYQFIPNQIDIVNKMLDQASKKVIISEPIRTLTCSSNPFVSYIAKHAANPSTGHAKEWFVEDSFKELFKANFSDYIEKFKYIPGKMEIMVVLNKSGLKEKQEEQLTTDLF